ANYIFTEGRRLESLSNKLLDLIVLGKQDFVKKPCRMGRLIAQAGGLFDQTFRQAGISLRCRLDDTVWPVEPDLFKTLLINLLDNARKAMPEGGEITLTAGRDGDDWRMTLTDTGRGMPPEAIPRLTEAFYRVDKARARASGGVGLGLKLTAEIVRIHGGELSFASEEGKGTTVTVVLKGGAA
ncbi:MAG: sensor histidine kinase, partial [Butyricicoccus sp.]